MKKILCVLMGVLFLSSMMSFADVSIENQSNEVKVEFIQEQSENIIILEDKKWVRGYSEAKQENDLPGYIMYSDQYGYIGTLSLIGVANYADSCLGFYEGYAYRDAITPWSIQPVLD